MSLTLASPITDLPGLGPRTVRGYARLGIHRVWDLLTHWPREEAFHTEHHGASARLARDGDVVRINATVTAWQRTPRRGKKVGTVTLVDHEGDRWVSTFFSKWPHWLERQFPVGSAVVAAGKVTVFGGRPYLQNLKLEPSVRAGRVHDGTAIGVVYPATQGLESTTIARHVRMAFDALGPIPEWLPAWVVAANGLMDVDSAWRAMHHPADQDDLARARERLVYDELFSLQIALQRNRNVIKGAEHGIMNAVVAGGVCDGFHASLPFALTGDQLKVMADVDRDMASPNPMHRLVQGDVGTGKTMVAAHAILRAIDAGRQAVLMVPTQVLAEQHASTMHGLMDDLYIERYGRFVHIDVLSANDTKKERAQVLARLGGGQTDLVVATHAVLEPTVAFADLGLVVIDEQHRFGVEHRRSLTDKRTTGDSPDLLVMTATPIPRSIALTLYGDLDVSTITERPGGDTIQVTTIALPKDSPRRDGLYAFIAQEVAAGRKAYIVCPLIEPSDAGQTPGSNQEHPQISTPSHGDGSGGRQSSLAEFIDLGEPSQVSSWEGVASVQACHAELSERFAPVRVGALHGRMSSSEREAVMADFRRGDVPILVTTTVIEVGVSVDESSVMIIEDADRFGISQLHQLRGRLFRGYPQNYCVLFSSKDPVNNPRLQALVNSADGFVLAETDLELRREGAIFGTNQTGAGELAFASLLTDIEVVAQTRADAAELLDQDPTLAHHPGVAQYVGFRHPDEHVMFADAG